MMVEVWIEGRRREVKSQREWGGKGSKEDIEGGRDFEAWLRSWISSVLLIKYTTKLICVSRMISTNDKMSTQQHCR